jgi:hypothetical protein
MGAIGTQRVVDVLNAKGHHLVELERYSTSNKIWATKVKRLRVPDLVCTICGMRIESRAKSTSALNVRMSHSPSSPMRAWDAGLRDSDLIAFIACTVDSESGTATVADAPNLFRVADLRSSQSKAKEGNRKSAAEGAELDITWPTYTPSFDAIVESVTTDEIKFKRPGGKASFTYKHRSKGFNAYVEERDAIKAGTVVAAGIVPMKVSMECPGGPYDFEADLGAKEHETQLAAIKGVGHRLTMSSTALASLEKISEAHENPFMRLEALGVLAKHNDADAARGLKDVAVNGDNSESLRMEACLILCESKVEESARCLAEIARACRGELRACALWGLGLHPNDQLDSITPYFSDADQIVAAHAVAAASKHMDASKLEKLFPLLSEGPRAASSVVYLLRKGDPSELGPILVERLRCASTQIEARWLLYSLGHFEESLIRPLIAGTTPNPETLDALSLLWTQMQGDWTKKVDMADYLDYVASQSIDNLRVESP